MGKSDIPTVKAPIERVPEKPRKGMPSTMTPRRLGGVVSAILAGDTVKAACASVAVAQTTHQMWMQRGNAAINEARSLTGEDDMEGALWAWIEENGGPQNGSPKAPIWTAEHPEWWPQTQVRVWRHAVYVVMVYWARGQAERIYRQTVTNAATSGDWKAAEFMLTHSFGWSKQDKLEVTGDNGGPVQVEGSEDRALAALAALVERKDAIEEATDAEIIDEEEAGADE